MLSPAIYANHSKAPNAVVQLWAGYDGVPPRMVLVTTGAVATGREIRIDYEAGGRRGQYWGSRVRPCAPVEGPGWRRQLLQVPSPSGAHPVLRYLERWREYERLSNAAADDEMLPPPPRAPSPAHLAAPAPWCDSKLGALVAQLQQTDWLRKCARKGVGRSALWPLIATHFSARTAQECQDRWRCVCAARELACHRTAGPARIGDAPTSHVCKPLPQERAAQSSSASFAESASEAALKSAGTLALKPGDAVSVLTRVWGDAWAKEAHGVDWLSGRTAGTVLRHDGQRWMCDFNEAEGSHHAAWQRKALRFESRR